MVQRTNGGVFNDQMLTGSLSHWVVSGADFSGAINEFGQPVPFSAAEIIFKNIESSAYINIMNPNSLNLSFALEEGRSTWTAESLQEMIRGLGTDVGVDHLDLSNVVVERVPYIFGTGAGAATSFLQLTDTPNTYSGSANYIVTVNPSQTGLIFTAPPVIPPPGPDTFLELLDTPNSYAGAAGFNVTVNPTQNGLIFTPQTAPPSANAYSFVAVPTQPTLTAVGNDTLTVIAGSNIVITTNALNNSLTINSTGSGPGSNNFIPVPAGTALAFDQKYFVTSAGIVTLPAITGTNTPGQAVSITKVVGITVFINVGDIIDVINTDLGTTDSIEYDATEALVFVVSDDNSWELQIGSVN